MGVYRRLSVAEAWIHQCSPGSEYSKEVGNRQAQADYHEHQDEHLYVLDYNNRASHIHSL